MGGLSGLTALADGSYLAISDDKGDYGPTRAYRLNIDNSGRAQVIGRVVFTNPDGSAYNPKKFDAEEIRQLPNGHLLWTTEGGSQGAENRSPLSSNPIEPGVRFAVFIPRSTTSPALEMRRTLKKLKA